MSSESKKVLLETALTEAAKAGRFGNGRKFIRCEPNSDGKIGDQYASSVVFINAVIGVDSNNDISQHEFKLIVKFLPDNEKVREIMNSNIQFSNEINMYADILPFLDHNDIVQSLFPKFYWGIYSVESKQDPIVIIEDLKPKNIGLSKQRVFLDFNHIILALKGLGKFHGLSYIMKQQKPIEFNTLKDKLREHAWDKTNASFDVGALIGPTALRGVKGFQAIQNTPTIEKLVKKLEADSRGLMKYFITPEESTAVICHGDFCNHNMLFAYEGSSEIPTAVRFIDLQTSRYASPVIDLSMILLLNTEPELRIQHWDEFIATYYNSVKDTVTAAGCIPPSFDSLTQELSHRFFYGYFHCSYFLPVLVSGTSPLNDISQYEPQEMMEQVLQVGGENATKYLVSIIKLLLEKNYFQFLD